jgi:hypothetical protein
MKVVIGGATKISPNAPKVFNTLELSLSRLAAGKLTYRRVAGGQDYAGGLHPEKLWGQGNNVLVSFGFMDVVPLTFLAVVTPKGLEPFSS